MADLSDKTRIPISWAVAIVSAVVGTVSSAAVGHYRIESLEKWKDSYVAAEVRDNEAQAESTRRSTEQFQQLELKNQKLEVVLDTIRDSIKKIERSLERMENGRGR